MFFNIKGDDVDDKNNFIKDIFQKLNYKNYLEIGLEHDSTAPYRIIKTENKHSVDTDSTTNADFIMTSDLFFDNLRNNKLEKLKKDYKWDVIFIDADHNCNQVYKDLENSLEFLSDDGIIFMHDVLPIKYERTLELAVPNIPLMNNDAWKVVHYILKEKEDLFACTFFQGEAGLGIIKKSKVKRNLLDRNINKFYKFSDMIQNTEIMMNRISPQDAIEWIKNPY